MPQLTDPAGRVYTVPAATVPDLLEQGWTRPGTTGTAQPAPEPEPDPAPATPPVPSVRFASASPLEDLPVAELRRRARGRGLTGASRMRKQDLIAALTAP